MTPVPREPAPVLAGAAPGIGRAAALRMAEAGRRIAAIDPPDGTS